MFSFDTNTHVVSSYPILDNEDDPCPVCNNAFTSKDIEEGKVVYVTTCRHVFHMHCLSRWLFTAIPGSVPRSYHTTCPFCRQTCVPHVRLLPREPFRRNFYSSWYDHQTQEQKAAMNAEWLNNKAMLEAMNDSQMSDETYDANIIFPATDTQNPNRQGVDLEEIEFIPDPPLVSFSVPPMAMRSAATPAMARRSAATPAMARRSAATPAIAAAGAVLGLFITYKLYSRARHI